MKINFKKTVFYKELRKIYVWIQEYLRRLKYKNFLIENKKFEGIGQGKRCFVIGNGPSLMTNDLDILYEHDEVTFAANKIYKLFNQTKWRPSYYAVCDTKLYREYKKDIDDISGEKFFPLDIYDKYIQEKKDNIHLFSRIPFQFLKNKPRFNPSLTGILSEGGTITYHLMQLAAAMGFQEIYLIGVDFSFSWGIGPDGKYFEDHSVKDHFSADKTKTDTMPNLYFNLQAYESAKKYAENHNLKIINATRGGKLEIFPRESFDELFTDEDFQPSSGI